VRPSRRPQCPTIPRRGVPTDLTHGERVVLDLLADGALNRRIAKRLVLSEHTAKGYVREISSKLGATSRPKAVAIARRCRLV